MPKQQKIKRKKKEWSPQIVIERVEYNSVLERVSYLDVRDKTTGRAYYQWIYDHLEAISRVLNDEGKDYAKIEFGEWICIFVKKRL